MSGTNTRHGWHVLNKEAAILWREYSFGPAMATTLVFKGDGDGLIVISPGHKVDAQALDELKEFGEVKALVASNGYHWLGQTAWRKHFPNARSFAPAAGISRILKKAPGLTEVEPLDAVIPLLGSRATITEGQGEKQNAFTNAFVKVTTDEGIYWYPSDILANMPKSPSNWIFKILMAATDSAPGFKVFRPAVWAGVKNKKELAAWALSEVNQNNLAAVIPAHGPPVTGSDVLERTKAALSTL